MPITSEEREYLKNKHKGGLNNSKGNTYENYYATYQIANCMFRYLEKLENVHFSSQLENAFVDDLLISIPDSHKTYHQLKNVASLTWHTGTSHTLSGDFKRQMEISSENKENFELKLIYSDQNSNITEIPIGISQYTSVVHFPFYSTLNQLILSYPPFKDAIKQITAQPEATDEVLSGIASAILGVWYSCAQESISLQQIVDDIQKMGKGYVNMVTYPTRTISQECQDIFNKIEGFTYNINGTTLYWSCGYMTGSTPWTEELESIILNINPTDKWALIELLG